MNSIEVLRTNISPYQAKDFAHQEKRALEALPGVKYLTAKTTAKPNILLTNTQTVLSEFYKEVLESAELIIHPNSGYDQFAQDMHLWKDIPVIVGNEIRAQGVAEYCLRCLFEGAVDLPQHVEWDKVRKWDRPLVKELPVWIFGYGHVGKILARTLAALGARVTIVDPYISECPFPHLKSWKDGKLSEARVIMLAMSLNKSSRRMLDYRFFENVHPELLLINPARGPLIEENALKDFLPGHPKAFAFLDTFEKEPFGAEWQLIPQVWKTSHIAGVDRDLDDRIINFEVKIISDWVNLGKRDFIKKHMNSILQYRVKNGELL
ncbi:MAG: NAD(P)-dependent oxidoreductase [Bacteriovoracaceae bacterium]